LAWPANWGDLGWVSPIIRHGLTIYAAEDDLVQTRSALNRYRMKLVRANTLATAKLVRSRFRERAIQISASSPTPLFFSARAKCHSGGVNEAVN
jgi:hypothetical protein